MSHWNKTVVNAVWVVVIAALFRAGHEAAAKKILGRNRNQLSASLVNVMAGAGQVVETYFRGCHMMLAAPDLSMSLVLVHRIMEQSVGPIVLLEIDSQGTSHLLQSEDGEGSTLRLADAWSKSKPSCRVLLLLHSSTKSTTEVRFLSQLRLWLQPRTTVVVMGGQQSMDVLLMDPVFRNTRLALYITPIAASPDRRVVQIYRRCLYCKAGDAGVHRLYRWSLDTGVPRNVDHFSAKYKEDFNGHRFRVVTLAYFPYINYVRGSNPPGTAVRLTDSLNTRMMEALARHLNFSYVVREPEDGFWGLRTSTGNWTGTVGTLQHEKADFSMDITLTPQRTAVLDFCRVYIDEDISILSLKPRPLPEYLSLIRPFEDTVWVAVVVGTMVWSTALWLLMSIKRNTSEKNLLNLSSSLFYGWGLLLEDQPYHPPAFSAGQLMVGMWLIACLILRASYTCSLISHLVVQGKSEPINSLEELVRLQRSKGWEWGTRSFDGAFNSLLTISTNQDYHIIKAHMQTMDMSTGIRRVMDGGFSYMRNYYAIRILKETYHSREAGDNPFHISTARYPLFAGNTWAFRRGTPFITRFDSALQRYLDSGLITHWMDDVISKHIREERQEKKATSLTTSTYAMTDGGEVVLGLQHLQATFYILILGLAAASFTFILEQVAGRRFSSSAERLVM